MKLVVVVIISLHIMHLRQGRADHSWLRELRSEPDQDLTTGTKARSTWCQPPVERWFREGKYIGQFHWCQDLAGFWNVIKIDDSADTEVTISTKSTRSLHEICTWQVPQDLYWPNRQKRLVSSGHLWCAGFGGFWDAYVMPNGNGQDSGLATTEVFVTSFFSWLVRWFGLTLREYLCCFQGLNTILQRGESWGQIIFIWASCIWTNMNLPFTPTVNDIFGRGTLQIWA